MKELFNVKYETWKQVCEMYFSLNTESLNSYLQWFPFTKLSAADKEKIVSTDFYNRYIKSGSFVLYTQIMHQSDNYIQKSDGSFRDSSLISPILYLVLQSVGKEIHDRYVCDRPTGISVYYAGNYNSMRPKYKQDYDNFFKELNASIDEYKYFIKTDISNFYANINVDKLVSRIDKVCNLKKVVFTPTQLYLYKELLKYCGNGRFPLIENSVASSFLSTVVYLDDVDTLLHKYISESASAFSSFRIVRYVDDMYILIDSDKPIECLHEAYNEIRNEYSSILKDYGLALNTKKCCLKKTQEINKELKKSLYDEHFNGQKHNIEELFSDALQKFLGELSKELLRDSIDVEKYNDLIDENFSSDDIEFTPSEVFNYFIYENDAKMQSEVVIKEVIDLVDQSISFISLDPKRLTVMIVKTHSGKAIKSFLNQLFKRDRASKWNSYDTTIAISYLIQSEFRHIDLLNIIARRHPKLYDYYSNNCKNSFLKGLESSNTYKLSEVIAHDSKAHYLYFMYLCELKRENHMAAFAYFKNFFDRTTADFDFIFSHNQQNRKPNYKRFYKESAFLDFYKDIDNSKMIIQEAHKIRNANPLSHSSSELLDNKNTTIDLQKNIKDLLSLIYRYINLQITSKI